MLNYIAQFVCKLITEVVVGYTPFSIACQCLVIMRTFERARSMYVKTVTKFCKFNGGRY